jgi:ubiquinone/menaquinone biosynthesis C-methylase UbiE
VVVDGSRNVKAGDWAAGLHPVTRSRAAATRAYDRMSSWSWLEEPFERRPRAIGLGLLSVHAGERVLELGCGAGGALIRLARAVGPSGCVVGLDLSPSMIHHAEARLRRARLADRVELRVADASSIPFDDASFDALFMSFTLELFDTPEIPLVLAECRRVLRSGGRLVVVALSRATPIGWPTRLYERLHDRFPTALDCRPIGQGSPCRRPVSMACDRRSHRSGVCGPRPSSRSGPRRSAPPPLPRPTGDRPGCDRPCVPAGTAERGAARAPAPARPSLPCPSRCLAWASVPAPGPYGEPVAVMARPRSVATRSARGR